MAEYYQQCIHFCSMCLYLILNSIWSSSFFFFLGGGRWVTRTSNMTITWLQSWIFWIFWNWVGRAVLCISPTLGELVCACYSAESASLKLSNLGALTALSSLSVIQKQSIALPKLYPLITQIEWRHYFTMLELMKWTWFWKTRLQAAVVALISIQ